MELDEGKIMCVFLIEFSTVQLSKIILETMMSHNKNVLHGSNLLVSVSKFGIDTTKNQWYRIISYRYKKAAIAHPY